MLQIVDIVADSSQTTARLEALEGRGSAERGLGLLPTAVATLRQVLDLTNDPIRRARVRGEIANALLHSDPDEAFAEVKAATDELEQLGMDATAAAIRLRLQSFEAMYCFMAGHYGEVLAIGEAMAPVAQSLGDARSLCRPQAVASWAFIGAGRVSEALQHSEQLLAFAEDSKDKSEVAMAEVDLGLEYLMGGAFSEAESHVSRARALYQESGNEVWLSNTHQLSARVLLAQGDLRGAREQAESALALVHEQQERWVAECQDVLGNVYMLAAEYDAAEASLQEALAIRSRIRHVSGMIDSLLGLGRLYERRGDQQRAEKMYVDALELARKVDVCPIVVGAWRQLGGHYCRMGDLTRGAPLLAQALQFASGITETIEYAPTLLAVSELEAHRGNLAAAMEYVRRALDRGGTVECRIDANVRFADLLVRQGSMGRAAQAAATALELAERFAAPFPLGSAHRAVARIAAASGQRAPALRHYEAALASFPKSGSLEYADTERELAEFRRSPLTA